MYGGDELVMVAREMAVRQRGGDSAIECRLHETLHMVAAEQLPHPRALCVCVCVCVCVWSAQSDITLP